MNCKAVQLKLSAYLDGELSGFDMLEVRDHLNRCRECGNQADELRSVKKMLGNMPEIEPDEQFLQRLNAAVFAAPKKPAYRPLSLALLSCIAFATALMVTLAGYHPQPTHVVAKPPVSKPDDNAFDVSRDQAYQSGGDGFNGGSFIITASSPPNASR
jgi:predicted anti-sigma-YlaC factor YlaD